jgi:hypothetical protein
MKTINNKGRKFGKLLWYDPNPADNIPIDLSELTISVDLQVTTKSRSIISVNSKNGTVVTDNSGESASINVDFFDGSKLGNSKNSPRALTTNYTNIQHLGGDLDEDYEALGIDSINIDFNSSYAPVVKIKFIDIRGAAMFSNGGSGKYKFFFDMPYPLFNLKIKGYYGKTVGYCLHLLRFNASFNSQTGNFEIDCDFIGFTYALLTDMLMGLVRASVTTKRGQAIFKTFKSEYKNKDSVITIDELIIKIHEIKETVKKIKEGEETRQVTLNGKARDEIENLRAIVINYLDTYTAGANRFTSNNSSGILIIQEPSTERKTELKKIEDDYLANVKKKIIDDIKPLVNFDSPEPNPKAIADELDANRDGKCTYFTDYGYVRYDGLSTSIISDSEALRDKLRVDFKNTIRLDNIVNLLQSINYKGVDKITIIDLSRAIKACNNSQKSLDNQNDIAVTNATDKLKTDIRGVLGFDPTIRNLFRVLCVSTEVFLQCILDVSREAETSGKREAALAKLRTGLDIIGKTNKVFPWPEYRKQGLESDGYYEEWMGNEIPTNDVPELKFTEELLTEMLAQARADKIRESDFENGSNWWPISVIDTPVDNGLPARMTNNPYRVGLIEELPIPGIYNPKGTSDEALRVMMYRVFLLLGVANRNKISDDLIKVHAKLEAENLYDVLKQMTNITFSTEIKNIIARSSSDDIYNKFRDATDYNFNGSTRNFFLESGTNCVYNYIVHEQSKRAYIPVNGNFTGSQFRIPDTVGELKHPNDIFNLRQTNGVLFVSNQANHTRISNESRGYNFKIDNNDGLDNNQYRTNYLLMDGAIGIKIISESAYLDGKLSPNFGLGVLPTGTSNIVFHNKVAESITDNRVSNWYPSPFNSGPYLANTYTKIDFAGGSKNSKWTCDNYTGAVAGDAGGVISPFIAFFNQVNQINGNNNYNYDEISFNGFASDYKPENRYYGWHAYNDKGNPDLSNGLDKDGYFRADNTVLKKPHAGMIEKYYTDYGKNREVINKGLTNKTIYVPKIEYCVMGIYSYSLFGSEFYYNQNYDSLAKPSKTVTIGNASKALLFLHCFPFQGVTKRGEPTLNKGDIWDRFMFDFNGDNSLDGVNESSTTNQTGRASEVLGIKGLFRLHNAFIETPRIWTLFIGAMLWRQQSTYETLKFFKDILTSTPNVLNELKDELIPQNLAEYTLIPRLSRPPRYDNFLTMNRANDDYYAAAGMHFGSKTSINDYKDDDDSNSYSRIDETLMGLPVQIKTEFINEFLSWVEKDFSKIQTELEIPFTKGTANESSFLDVGYRKKWSDLNKKYVIYPGSTGLALKKSDVATILGQNIVDNYIMVAPISNEAKMEKLVAIGQSKDPLTNDEYGVYVNQEHAFNMELNPDGEGMRLITKLLLEKVYIQNVTPEAWNPPNLMQKYTEGPKINKLIGKGVLGYTPITIRQSDLKMFITTFQSHFYTISAKFDEEVDTEENKLQQEMFNSMDDDKIKLNIYRTLMSIYQKWIGGLKGKLFTQCSINTSDKAIANTERGDANNTKLIDSFRFLDRSFNDIGDVFYMNPQVFYNIITKNRNASFFDVANKVLSDNNFNFIPLPTFVNFNNPDELADIFEPYPWNDQVVTGPSFVCVYAGQSSTNLDLGVNSNYPDDGIFINVDNKGNQVGMPDDFVGKGKLSPYETNVPVFTVNYGQQNQNYFKDVKLDQSEFSETAESLEIIDDISQGGDKMNRVMVGQNLFNTYQKRSYSCEVEMLGCALIQPMMYFQLNNIPMFRGLYLIINVSHSIKPNGMTTTFKGVRVKKTKTPLLTASDVLMNLIGDVSNVNTGGSTIGGSSSGGCVTPNYSFAFTTPPPPADTMLITDAVAFLKTSPYPNKIGKAVLAILYAEASQNSARTAFNSAGGHNYAGVQTDGGKWGAPGIIGQYCRTDSGGNRRAFAIFESDETFLDFMCNRVESKGLNGDDGDEWTSKYIKFWWSPVDKASYTIGTPVYNSKLSIYRRAMNAWS